jgi:hypothetical protein
MKNIMGFNREQAEKALTTKATDGPELGASSNLIQSLQDKKAQLWRDVQGK